MASDRSARSLPVTDHAHAGQVRSINIVAQKSKTVNMSTDKQTGAELITAKYQKNKVRFSGAHDSYYTDGQLKQAAGFTLYPSVILYPVDWDEWYHDNVRHKNSEIENLVNAGALIAAEIDRLQTQNP